MGGEAEGGGRMGWREGRDIGRVNGFLYCVLHGLTMEFSSVSTVQACSAAGVGL